MSRTYSLRKRLVACVSTVALGAGGGAALLASAPAAEAAPQQISSGSLAWGFKSSFRTYIVNIAAGSITASDGATKASSSATASFNWAGAGGTYDPATKVGELDYAGKVVFRSTAHGIWNITIANPSIVLDGDSTGTLVADVSYRTGGTEANPENVSTQADVAFGDVTVTAPTVSGSTYTFTDQAVALTQAGSAAFDGFYEPGAALDPATATASVRATEPPTTTPPTTTPTNPPTTTPAKPNPLAQLLTSLGATLTALLAALGGK